jgi:hypothetical protein
MVEMSLIVAISVPLFTTAPGEMFLKETKPEKGAVITRSPICAWTPLAWARAAAAAAICASSLALVAKPRSRSVLIRESCCCGLLALREHGKSLAAAHEAAVVEAEAKQAFRHLRGDRHLLVGVGGADRLDGFHKAHALRRLDLDERRRAPAFAFLLAAIAAGGGEAEKRQG